MSIRIYLTSLITLFGLLLGGCGGGANTSDQAKVRFIHVSPGTDSVNVTRNDDTIVSGVKYHDNVSYVSVDIASAEFKIKSVANGSVYVDTTFALTTGTRYTYIVYGGASSESSIVVNDDTADVSSNKVKLRVVNVATGVGQLDLYLLSSGSDVNSATPTASGI